MSVLSEWNESPRDEAEADARSCCGSRRWLEGLCAGRPYADEAQLLRAAQEIWRSLEEVDWLEAFGCHPRIGERVGQAAAVSAMTAQFAAWSNEEQGTAMPEEAVKSALAEGNCEYEREYGFLYIVCASGKTPEEMLAILRSRLGRSREMELREAALQQERITDIRLRKWLRL